MSDESAYKSKALESGLIHFGLIADQPAQERQSGRFERSADAGHEQVRAVYHQRGGEYSDTWETCQWFYFKSVAKKLLGVDISTDQARAMTLAGIMDQKYERLSGGFKTDNLIDGLAYGSSLLGELKQLGIQ